jgi:ATP-dependent DNA helicase PIF1
VRSLVLSLSTLLSPSLCIGMTIERVEMKLGEVFEAGQAYVALSRATSLEGLRLLSFDKRKIFTDPQVVEFYASLE